MEFTSTPDSSAQQYIAKFAVLLCLLCLTPACSQAQPGDGSPQIIHAGQAKQWIEQGALMLDVRSSEEWQQGHLRIARHLPMTQFETLAGQLEINKDTPIVLHCRSGGRASRAAKILQKLGYSQIAVVKPGGYSELRQAGFAASQ